MVFLEAMKVLIGFAFWVSWIGTGVLSFSPQLPNSKTPRASARFLSLEQTSPTAEAISRVWDFQGHECYSTVTKPTNGNLFVQENKPEILLIHGFGCSTVYWRETIKYLTQAGYTVHAVDLLGQGKSSKPGRAQGIEYSISLWARMMDAYLQQFVRSKDVVVMGNSLGSLVALTVATETDSSSNVKGIGMYNCGIGLNTRNFLRDPSLNTPQRAVFTALFALLDALIFNNIPLLTYLLNKVVTKELLNNVLVGLYSCAPEPETRVDQALVDSFYFPAKEDGSVEALNQIYTNDAGKTPMEIHQEYESVLQSVPIHLVWGSKDSVTPLEGPVGQFYTALAKEDNKVTMNVIESGHIPFDEIPECNDSMVKWLNEVVASDKSKPLFQWPFSL